MVLVKSAPVIGNIALISLNDDNQLPSLMLITRRTLCVLFALLIIAGAAWTICLTTCDPLKRLPAPESNLSTVNDAMPPPKGRILNHVTLHSEKLGDIGIVISLPDPLPTKKLPLLIVLGGLGTGGNNIRYIDDARKNAIIGYDWPMPIRFPSGFTLIQELPQLYHQVMTVPGQIVSAVGWLSSQPWADNTRISLLGFSLGALAVPAVQDVAQHNSITIGWTIIAYGGAPLGALFTANPHMKPVWLRYALGPLIDFALWPCEPTRHLKQLHGHFLVLEGNNDELIPAAARSSLRDAVPNPKDVVIFDGNHMGVGKDKLVLLQRIIQTSRNWLINNGAVNAM